MSPESTALVILPAEAGNSLLEAAEMEFQATLQLLADRACWVSGARAAEIALQSGAHLRYAAVSGASQREPGSAAPRDEAPFRHCLTDNRIVHARAHQGSAFCMAVPIPQDGEAVGFVNLLSEEAFNSEDETAVARIAELVEVALQHRDAAARAERLEFRDSELELPSLWSAPENVRPNNRAVEAPQAATKTATQVETCAACGFPVSPGRSLCVECELKPETAIPAKDLFQSETEEIWLSAHGYTIASVLVTVLTAAIILWLRH